MKKIILFFSLFTIIIVGSLHANKIQVVTTTEDLASIARLVGGDKAKVLSLSKGWQDLHLIEPRPSMVVKLSRADILVRIGMDLDMWIEGLIDASKNKKIYQDASGYIDASKKIEPLEKPEGHVHAGMGDVHIYGNPHYWLDPRNGILIAENIADGLISASPDDKEYFDANLRTFKNELSKKIKIWKMQYKDLKNKKIITYHKTWTYLADFLNMEVIATIEPKPGIPPRPAHIKNLLDIINNMKPKMIIQAPFYSKKQSKMLSRETGVPYLILPSSAGAIKEAEGYFDLFEYIIAQIDGINE